MSELDYELTPALVRVVRVNLFGFLSHNGRAPRLWTAELKAGNPIFVPPGSEHVPPDELGAWLAAELADRVAKARLFWLDPAVGDLAIQTGADMSLTGGIIPVGPPRPYGLLLCPNGLGYSADGMVVIAAAWGPIHDGYWITWWADSREYIEWTGKTGAEAEDMLRWMGMLHFITGAYLTMVDATPEDLAANRSALHVAPQPHPMLPRDTGTLRGCVSATVGAWWLLYNKTVDLDAIAPSEAHADQDRQHGLVPSKVTRAYLAETPDPARLWDYDAGPIA